MHTLARRACMHIEARYTQLMEQSLGQIGAAYDGVARQYADRFASELEHKPLDCELLGRFAAEVRGRGPVLDIGCGPGQTTALLAAQGVDVRGLDLSRGILLEARRLNPQLALVQADMRRIPAPT